MSARVDRTYRTRAFAALAGVTPRALRHYDRLGLLKPERSAAGYRIYSERDLETLQEIVALKFIGVPLKAIAAIRHRDTRPFGQVLSAQRLALETKRQALSRAIEAVTAAEAVLRSGSAIDAALFRRIIEVMHMDTHHDETIARYSALLKAKAAHLSAMSAEQRADLRRQWVALIDDVKAALDHDPAGPVAQALLDRWIALLQALTGSVAPVSGATLDLAIFRPTAEFQEELWARRADWLPADASRDANAPNTSAEAMARLSERAQSFVGTEVMDFIARARAARV